jgi:multisubunit Na+/H+ antiporter MnhE subunit
MVRCLCEWVGLLLLWILFVFQVTAEELIFGVVAAGVTVVAVETALRAGGYRFRARWLWIAQIWHLPSLVVKDLWLMTGDLARRLAGKPGRSVFRIVPFRFSSDASAATGQKGLAVLLLTTTPNSVVLDATEDGLLLHELVSAPVPRMVRRLEE